jgi:ABC-2 type transport system permease protein
MNVPPISRAHLDDLDRPTLWWSAALAGVTALVAAGFATVDGQTDLDESVEELPDAVRALVGGLDGVSFTSPAGYLHGQLFANLFPVLLTVLAIGLGARAIGGAESDGHLQLIATHPVSRTRIAVERALVALLSVTLVAIAGLVALLVAAPFAGLLDEGPATSAIVAAAVGSWALAILYGSVAFAVGAFTGSRTAAVATSSSIAVGGFVLQSVAASADALDVLGTLSPWQWFADAAPLVDGAVAVAGPVAISLVVAVAVAAVGVGRFRHRDLR